MKNSCRALRLAEIEGLTEPIKPLTSQSVYQPPRSRSRRVSDLKTSAEDVPPHTKLEGVIKI